jgi:hypothetical protein
VESSGDEQEKRTGEPIRYYPAFITAGSKILLCALIEMFDSQRGNHPDGAGQQRAEDPGKIPHRSAP